MKFCPNCGTLTYEETEICPGCGEPFRDIKRYCPNCGNEFSPGDNYCMYCGADVSGIPSMLNGSTDKRSSQKPKKPKRHRIRRFLKRLLEILLILAAILWCVAYYEDYDLRLKVYDTIRSASEIVPSLKTVLGIDEEEPPIIAEPAVEDPIDDDETVIVETPGDARKVDVITIVIVNQAKEAALEAEDENDRDAGFEDEVPKEGSLPAGERPGRGQDENGGPGQGRQSGRRLPGEEDGYPPESGEYDDLEEFDDFGDIVEYGMIGEADGSDETEEPDESGEIEEFRSFRRSDEAEGSDEFGTPERREPHETRRRHSSHRPDRLQTPSMPPERPGHGPDEAGSGSDPE